MAVAEAKIIISAVDKASGVLKGIGGALGGLGRTAGVALAAAGVAMTAFGVAAVKVASTFEDEMAILGIAASSAGASIDQIRQYALKMGAETVFSAQESAEAMTGLYKAGLTAEDVMGDMSGESGVLKAAMDLAAASGIDLATAADYITVAMSTYGRGTEDAVDIANNFVQAADASVAEVDGLAQALVNVGPIMDSYGYSLEDTNTALAMLSQGGIEGSEAGTALKSMFGNLLRPTNSVTEALDTLGVSLYDSSGTLKEIPTILGDFETALEGVTDAERNEAIMAVAGNYGKVALAALLKQGADGWYEMEEAISNAATAETYAEARMATFSGVMEELGGTIETMLITVGTPLIDNFLKPLAAFISSTVIPAFQEWVTGALVPFMDELMTLGAEIGPQILGFLETMARTAQPLIEQFAGMTSGGQSLAQILAGGLLSAVRWFAEDGFPPLVAAGQFVLDHWKVFGAAAAVLAAVILVVTSPIVAVVAALAALYVAWTSNWGGIQDKTAAAMEFIQGALEPLQPLFAFVRKQFGVVVAWVQENWPLIQETVQVVMEAVSAIVKTVLGFISRIFSGEGGAMLAVVTATWENIKTIISTAIEVVLAVIKAVMQMITGDWDGAWETIKGIGETVWDAILAMVENATEALKAVWEANLEFLTEIWNSVAETASTVWEGIREYFAGLWESITAAVTEAWDGVKEYFAELWEDLTTKITGVWDDIETFFADTWQSIQDTIQDVWNDIKSWLLGLLEDLFAAMGLDLDEMRARWSAIWEDVRAIAAEIWNRIVTTVTDKVEEVRGAVTDKIERLRAYWSAVWEVVRAVAVAVWSAIVTAVTTKVGEVYASITAKIDAVKSWWETAWGTIQTVLETAWSAIVTAVATKVGEVHAAITGKVGEIQSWWERTWGDIKEALDAIFGDMVRAVVAKMGEVYAAVQTKINAIKTWIGAQVGAFKSIGSNIINAIKQGVLSAVGGLIAAAVSAVEAALAAAKAALGISSASTEFIKIGEAIVAGLVEGILAAAADAEDAVEAVMGGLMKAAGVFGGLGSAAAKRLVDPLKARVEQLKKTIKLNEDILKREDLTHEQREIHNRYLLQAQAHLFRAQGKLTAAEKKALEIEKQRADLAFLKEQMKLLDMIAEYGLDPDAILGGLELGLDANLEGILDAMTRAMAEILTQIEDQLGITSPSQVFAEIGQQMMQGLAMGVEGTAAVAAGAVGEAVTGVTRAGGGPLAAIDGTRATTVNFTYAPTLGFATDAEMQDAARMLKVYIDREAARGVF